MTEVIQKSFKKSKLQKDKHEKTLH